MSVARHLRDYQAEAVNAVFEKWKTVDITMLDMATGAGKTIVVDEIFRRAVLEDALGLGRRIRCLLLADRRDLIFQGKNKIEKNSGLSVQIEMGEHRARRDLFRDCDVLISSFQSQTPGRRSKPTDFDIVVVDECHSCNERNKSWMEPLAHYRQNPHCKVLGVTATPDAECLKYFKSVDKVAYAYPILRGIKEGYLVNVEQKVAHIKSLDFSHIRTTCGDLNATDLARVMEDEKPLQAIVQATLEVMFGVPQHSLLKLPIEQWSPFLFMNGKPKVNLIFCASVDHARMMSDILNRVHPGISDWVCSDKKLVSEVKREQVREAFATGKLLVVCNMGIYSKGYDNPLIEMVTMARPTKSEKLYKQCLDSETEILSTDGWTRIDHPMPSKFACYDPASGNVSWMAGEKTERLLGGEKMWGITSPHLDIRVTAGHRMLVESRHGRNKIWSSLQFRKAGSLEGRLRIPVSCLRSQPDAPVSDCDISFLGMLLTDGTFNPLNNAITLFQSEKNPKVIKLIENTLDGCGFKFGHSINRKPSNFGPRSPLHIWTISKGMPRGRDAHLTGWGRLSDWVSTGKQLTPAFELLSPRQVDLLIQSLQAGNGTKIVPIDYNKGSMDICFANPILANQIQSLAVRSGWRCNAAALDSNSPRLHLSRDIRWSLALQSSDSRPIWGTLPSTPNEMVWCVTVPTGAIITRRNGKVAIVGNSIGRGTRTLDGVIDGLMEILERLAAIASSAKKILTVLDLAGNSGRHDLVTSIDILGENASHDAKVRAKEKAKKEAKPRNVMDLIKESQEELAAEKVKREEAQRRKEAIESERKKHLVAKSTYSLSSVSPFEQHDVKYEAPTWWDKKYGHPLSEAQRNVLRVHVGVDPDSISLRCARKLIGAHFNGPPTPNQVKYLKWKKQDLTGLTKRTASELIDKLKAQDPASKSSTDYHQPAPPPPVSNHSPIQLEDGPPLEYYDEVLV